MLAAALLAISLAALAWFLKNDRAEMRRFRALSDTAARQARYRRWIGKAWLAFALPPVVGLALLGRLDALMQVPAEFAPATRLLPAAGGEASSSLFGGLVIGAVIGGVAVGVMTRLRQRKGQAELPTMGDFAALLPRNPAEAWLAGGLSVTAGVTEEIAFRLFLPLLLVLVTGSAVAAFGLAAVLFGAMHLYQGWKGVLATTVVGLVMTALYLVSGALWLAVVAHALIDVMGLVVRPALSGALKRA